MLRRCYACGETKPLDQFVARKERKSGRGYKCKKCHGRSTQLWAKKNPERRRAAANKWYQTKGVKRIRDERARLKQRLIEEYGPCRCCGETTPEFLTLEHLDNGGAQHRRSLVRVGERGGIGFQSWHSVTMRVYQDVERQGFPKDAYCLLCWNCHMATRQGKSCPHVEMEVSRVAISKA
jgi:hypothetical protein